MQAWHITRAGVFTPLGRNICDRRCWLSVRQLWLQSLPKDQIPACGPDLSYMLEAFPLATLLRPWRLEPATAPKSAGRCWESAFQDGCYCSLAPYWQ